MSEPTKVKITVTETEKRKVDVEVEFPFYREHDVGGDTYEGVYYTRVEIAPDGKPRQVSLHWSKHWSTGEESWAVEVDRWSGNDGSSMDYVLGRGVHALTADEWEAKRRSMFDWMQKAGVLP